MTPCPQKIAHGAGSIRRATRLTGTFEKETQSEKRIHKDATNDATDPSRALAQETAESSSCEVGCNGKRVSPLYDEGCNGKRTALKLVASHGSAAPELEATSNDESIQVAESADESSVSSCAKKRVSFADLEIRCYPITLGDNPQCSSGPPIQIDWDYSRRSILPIDQYEANRRPRRNLEELELSYYQRVKLLRRYSDCTEEEIIETLKEMNRIKRQRKQTLRFLRLGSLQSMWESTGRKVVRLFRRRKSDC